MPGRHKSLLRQPRRFSHCRDATFSFITSCMNDAWPEDASAHFCIELGPISDCQPARRVSCIAGSECSGPLWSPLLALDCRHSPSSTNTPMHTRGFGPVSSDTRFICFCHIAVPPRLSGAGTRYCTVQTGQEVSRSHPPCLTKYGLTP